MLFSKSGHHPQSCNCHQSRDRLLKEVLSSLTEQEQEFGHFCSTRMNAIKTKTTFLAVKKKKAKDVNNPYKPSYSYLNKAF